MRSPLLWIAVGVAARTVLGFAWRVVQVWRDGRAGLTPVSDAWRQEHEIEVGKSGSY